MSLVNKHNRCVAIKLFRFRRTLVELVYCPAGEVVEPHHHDHVDGTMIMLGGEIIGTIGDRTGFTGGCDFLRRFRIPRGVVHSCVVTGRFFLFLNIERWDCAPTSAAIDFITTNNHDTSNSPHPCNSP